MNLTKEQFSSLKTLSKTDSLVIQKSDKENCIDIISKDACQQKMLNILPDSSKFSQIYITNEKKLNFLGNIELQIIDLLKQLIDFQVNSKHEKLKPRGSRFGILYGLCKIQKSLIGSCSPFLSIFSAIETPYFTTAKHLVPILEPITTNKFTIKNIFEFAKEVIE